MAHNKKTNHMYPWVTKKRNFIGGECPHQCIYCYVNHFKKKWKNVRERYSGKPFLIEKELEKNEGSGQTIFVQDCGDLFAEAISSEWIARVLDHLRDYPENTCLFQSKNPKRFLEFISKLPVSTILATTIETNRPINLSRAPDVNNRAKYIKMVKEKGFDVMVSVEPVVDFDLNPFSALLSDIGPNFISIGADSKGHNLTEPSSEKIQLLIDELKKFTKVKVKGNLNRLIERHGNDSKDNSCILEETPLKYINEKEVSDITGISLATLRNDRFLNKGISYIKLGKSVRYNLKDVIDYMERHRIEFENTS